MRTKEKLKSLLQPKDYKTKLRMYCNPINFEVKKFKTND